MEELNEEIKKFNIGHKLDLICNSKISSELKQMILMLRI